MNSTPLEPSSRRSGAKSTTAVPVDRIVELFGGECFTVSDLQQVGLPLVHVSPEFRSLTGYEAAEAAGRDLGFLQHSDTEQQANREIRDAIAEGRPCTVILRNYRKDGSLFWNEQRHYPVRSDAGVVTHLITVQRDVTDRMNAAMSQDVGEAMARYLEEEGRFYGYSLLLRDDREPTLAWLAEAVRHLVGLSAAEIRTRGLMSIIHSEDRDLFVRRLGRIRRSVERTDGGLPTRIFRDRYRLLGADGKVVWVEDAASVAWQSAEAGVTAIHAVVRDITSLRKSQHEFWQLSHFDALTGLPNRNLFTDRVQQALGRARRNGTHVAVVMLDLAGVRLSHEATRGREGDRILRRLAEDMRRTLRRSDTLARFEGDVFALMVADLNEPEDIVAVLDKLAAVLAPVGARGGPATRPGDAAPGDMAPAPSIGAALAGEAGESVEDLLDTAQEALERAKARDGHVYVIDDASLAESSIRRIRLQSDLVQALAKGEFVVHYQPRVRLATGEITGVAALLRWLHPERGLLKPPDFLDQIRSTGTSHQIFQWVLTEACRQAAAWAAARTPYRVAVHVPDSMLDEDAFAAVVMDSLAGWDLHPALLELELDGTSAPAAMKRNAHKLTGLRTVGVRVSLGGFGVSATPLLGLRDLPLDSLKIAGPFQRELTAADRDVERALLASIVALAKSLDLQVVAEWVETEEQRDVLQAIGCDEAQGFLFGHAIPAEHVRKGQLGPVESRS